MSLQCCCCISMAWLSVSDVERDCVFLPPVLHTHRLSTPLSTAVRSEVRPKINPAVFPVDILFVPSKPEQLLRDSILQPALWHSRATVDLFPKTPMIHACSVEFFALANIFFGDYSSYSIMTRFGYSLSI